MKKDVVIIHYNTPKLTEATIKSLNKTTEGCHVIVFDNSDKEPFVNTFDNVEVLDNTKGQLIDFDKWLEGFPDKTKTPNGWASAKHCRSVQWLVDKRKNPFVLMDSDVLVKKDITEFWNEDFAYIGEVIKNVKRLGEVHPRLLPFLCYVNVRMMHNNGNVSYFNPKKMYALTSGYGKGYDTGSWFVEDCENHGLPFRELSLDSYIVHMKAGSWKSKDVDKFLEDNKDLWQ